MTTPPPDLTTAPHSSQPHDDGEALRTGRRSDAQRNRQRIVAAARQLYATQGLGVSMAAVARQAGLGKATLSRHFATPQHLIDAVFLSRMDGYVHATTEALGLEDPWEGFVQFISAVCGLQAEDRGFADVLTLSFRGGGEMERRRSQGYHGFLLLVERAQATGRLRPDFTSADLVLLLMANAGVVAATSQDAPESWRRLAGQLLRAYAAPGAPLPPLPAPPTSDSLYAAMTRLGDRAGDLS